MRRLSSGPWASATLGPIDGHDIAALEQALRAAARDGGPVVVHARTAKGRGYQPAEADAEKRLHDVGPFDLTGRAAAAPGARTFASVFGETLTAEAARRPRGGGDHGGDAGPDRALGLLTHVIPSGSSMSASPSSTR